MIDSHTRKKNYIFSLEINDNVVYDQQLLHKHVTDFYQDLLGTTTSRSISLQPSFWDECPTLSLEQIHFLKTPFTALKINKKIVFFL
jgi:hypothetical protein